jgi:hypothetical protein
MGHCGLACLGLLGACAGAPSAPDVAPTVPLFYMRDASSAEIYAGRGGEGELFGRTQAYIWGELATGMLSEGLSHADVTRQLSGKSWPVGFIDSVTLVIAYWGKETTSDGEHVWVVRL